MLKRLIYLLFPILFFGFNESERKINTAPPPTDYDTVFGSPAWNASVHLPSTYYTSAATDSFECIIMMGGLGETGTNVNLNYRYGPLYWINQGWNGQVTLGNGIHTPIFIVLQNPNAGTYAVESALKTRVDLILARYKIKRGNRNSLHGTGLSAGGWQFTTFVTADPLGGPYVYARYFASVVEVQGVKPEDNAPYPQLFSNYATVGGNLLAFEGTNDERDVESRVNRMNATVPGSAQYIYTNYSSPPGSPPGSHCCWNTNYNPATVYTIGGLSQNIYQWMLRQGDTSLVPTGNSPPTCDAGANQSITSPTSSVTLTATASDPGGSIASYQWAKVTGGSATITSPTSISTSVTGLTVGIYRFTITVTDNLGATCADFVEITVNPSSSVNANAGTDQSITRFQKYTTLSGAGSTGTGLTYSWRKITSSSPTFGNIISPTAQITDVMILPYFGANGFDFELTVANGFSTDKDTVRVNVTWGTMPPQRTTLRLATAADVTTINALGNPGLCRLGDLIIDGANDGWSIGGQFTDIYINVPALLTTTPLTSGKRILIKSGKYRKIQLQFGVGQVVGATNNKIRLTNYGGQVEYEQLIVDNIKHVLFTGKYVLGQSGHPSYPGHANGAYAFSSGTYGFYGNANWANIESVGFAVRGSSDSCTFEFLEIGNGNFSGFQLLQHNVSDDMDSMILKDAYIHRIHSEIVYSGTTQGDPSHQFKNLIIENVRGAYGGGETPQQGQLNSGNRIQRNVFIGSGSNCKSPFSDSQDFGMQVGIRNGKNYIIGNIILGAGEQLLSMIAFKKPAVSSPFFQDSITSNQDTVFVRRNLMINGGGHIGAFIGGTNPPYNIKYRIDSNYFGRFTFKGNDVFTDARGTNTQEVFRAGTPPVSKFIFRNNKRDNTKTIFLCPPIIGQVYSACDMSKFDTSGNTVQTIAAPLFENSGFADGFAFQTIEHWADTLFKTNNDENSPLGGTKQGQAWTYSIGDWAMHLSRYYQSLVNNNHSHMPKGGGADEYWVLRYWLKPNGDTSYLPPDDFRLRAGDPYRALGIGLYDTLVTTTLNTYYRDADGDTYGTPNVTIQAGSPPAGYVVDNTDCNDNNAAISPADPEIYNSLDDDCDGLTDEGFNTYYRDLDGDTYGNSAVTTQATSQPVGYVSNSLDCNDGNAAISPADPEIFNGVDDNCNGQIDEGFNTYYQDNDGDTYGNPNVSTQATSQPIGFVSNNLDCNDSNANIKPGGTEICNGIDDDCDLAADEGLSITYYRDLDGDTYGNINVTAQACSPPSGYVVNSTDCNDNNAAIKPSATEICDGVDNDCDALIDEGCSPDNDADTYTVAAGDCNDSNPNINPGATEICNSVDDDCDGQIDEGVKITYYRDADGDTFGDPNNTILACSPPAGYVTNNTDCNDNSSNQRPTGTEACNGLDDDCDGTIDEGVKTTYYQDLDGDGFGNSASSTQSCSQPSGYVANSTDCNDNSATRYPGAPELCNSIDDDCDGSVDEGLTMTKYYYDFDGDGQGDPTNPDSINICIAPPGGYVTNKTDCNDANAAVFPGATEICDGVDNDCDGSIDEGVKTTYYQDSDGDTYGNLAVSQQACSQPSGYVTNSTDCNDNNSAIKPGATEVCDGIDNDCDGSIDEGLLTTFYRDADGDNYGNPAISQTVCYQPIGYVTNNTDCNDGNSSVHPGASEICGNSIDDDCDGSTDEGATFTFYQDADGDGFGNVAVTVVACAPPAGYVNNSTDCNDANAAIKPSATEILNGIDDDCDGQVDEGVRPRVSFWVRFWKWIFG